MTKELDGSQHNEGPSPASDSDGNSISLSALPDRQRWSSVAVRWAVGFSGHT